MLKVLKTEWAPLSYVISFKLETDPSLLLKKSTQSLNRYNHQLVVGNILSTRKRLVTLSYPDGKTEDIVLSDDELKRDPDANIENHLIPHIVRLHKQFVVASKAKL